jgi:hypothetical protein
MATGRPGELPSPTTASTAPRRIQLISVPSVPQQLCASVTCKADVLDASPSNSQERAERFPGRTPNQQNLPGNTKDSSKDLKNNSPSIKPLELSSLTISAKPDDAPGKSDVTESKEMGGKQQKRRLLLTTLSPKETVQNVNSINKGIISRKPIPLEPTVIVLD